MSSAPQAIVDLVERFAHNADYYRGPSYNETQVRGEFLDPFFAALGWDIYNRAGVAPAYQSVILQATLRTPGSPTTMPDYSFRVGPERKFFVEAKKPSVDIASAVQPAYQLRRYAWTARLPLSILTDFEQFSVYDCRTRPNPTDNPAAARLLYFQYQEYAQRWDEIANVFGHDAVWRGDYDRYAATAAGKRGTQAVDDAFLQEIEAWRELLARNLALRNPDLTVRALNYAVQQTIDRIIFLRFCEDRGIEPYEQLKHALPGSGVYARLMDLFRRADDRYNSGLFHLRGVDATAAHDATAARGRGDADTVTPGLQVDDKVLAQIIGNLYYPHSPYAFDVLSADILGNVYERFLGSVIRLTAGHQAKVEQKPEVRKAGGVYYTPQYIVNYIVRHTVGPLCEGQPPGQIAKLRCLDPACGSGSFLLGAYQFLLDYHLDWYVAHPTKQARREVYQGRGGQWFLTTEEKKRILLNNLYGVDIDPQAVEVTKLSLLLKVLEGENQDTLATQARLWQDRALPDLSRNIQCGNSLIGPDYYETQQLGFLDEDEAYRVNAFDWDREFASVMREGGFDVVIGNPPYIRIQMLKEWAPKEVQFYKQRYVAASKGNYDIYVVFVEKGLSLFNPRGRLGFILPHKFFNAEYGAPLRQLIAEGRHLAEVVHFGDQQVFENATTYTCLMFLDKAGSEACQVLKVDDLAAWRASGAATTGSIPAAQITGSEWNFSVGRGAALFERLSKMPVKLGDVASMFVGLQTSADTVFLFKDCKCPESSTISVLSKELGKTVELETALLKPVVRSGSIGRFWAEPTALVLFPYRLGGGKSQLIPEEEMKRQYPKTWAYLAANRKLLSGREHGKFAETGWYQLYPKNLDVWEQPKIMLPYMITRLSAFYDESGSYFVNVTTGGFGVTVSSPNVSPKYVTGLLNSRLLDLFMRNVSTSFHGGYFAANKQFLVQLPIRPIDFANPADVAQHDQMVALVERMLALHKRLAAAQLPQAKTMLQRQIEATDQQIDRLVYALYGLTEEEIKIVESPS